MKYAVVESFSIKTPQGYINTLSPGTLLDLSPDQAAALGGKVRAADEMQDTDNWRPAFKAWLEGDTLFISGVTDDLAGEIIKLTADDLPLQRRLLKLHCGRYDGPWWTRLVERWQERAAIMQYDGGLTRDDAEHQAAVCLRAEMFIDELRNMPT